MCCVIGRCKILKMLRERNKVIVTWIQNIYTKTTLPYTLYIIIDIDANITNFHKYLVYIFYHTILLLLF